MMRCGQVCVAPVADRRFTVKITRNGTEIETSRRKLVCRGCAQADADRLHGSNMRTPNAQYQHTVIEMREVEA